MCFELGKLAEVYLFVAALALPFLSEKSLNPSMKKLWEL